MKCWLSLGRWFDSGSKEFGLNLAHTFPHFLLTSYCQIKKAISLDPNLTRYATERTFSILHITRLMSRRDRLTPT